jgi:hypothetical protein
LADNPRNDHKVVLRVEENSHVMLFCQQSLLQLQSHFLNHILIGSIYVCHVNFSLVAFGNGVMTDDWWCRDETESLLWARTHGWAARHVLVSRLIVMIHYGTTPMCYLWWKFSKWSLHFVSAYRDILSKSIFIILSNPISWICTYLQPESYMLLHPWRSSFESRDEILFKGGRLWHPRCQFRVMSGDLS